MKVFSNKEKQTWGWTERWASTDRRGVHERRWTGRRGVRRSGRGSECCSCGMVGNIAKDCRAKGEGKSQRQRWRQSTRQGQRQGHERDRKEGFGQDRRNQRRSTMRSARMDVSRTVLNKAGEWRSGVRGICEEGKAEDRQEGYEAVRGVCILVKMRNSKWWMWENSWRSTWRMQRNSWRRGGRMQQNPCRSLSFVVSCWELIWIWVQFAIKEVGCVMRFLGI